MNKIQDQRFKNSDQLLNEKEQIEIIYHGSKNFWRTGDYVDIIIVLHERYNCIEVISYNPELNVEANRIYLNYELLEKNISENHLSQKM